MEAIEDLNPVLLPLGFHPLHIAAIRRDPKALKELLHRGYRDDLDVRDTHGRTPLLVALQNGRAECAKLLIAHGAEISASPAGSAVTDLLTRPPGLYLLEELVSEAVPSLSSVPLAQLLPAAGEEGNAAMLRNLISVYGVDVNYSDLMGRNALHYACQRGHLGCVQLLLNELGADPQAVDSHCSTPLHLACASNHLDVVRTVTNACPDPSVLSGLLNAQNVSGQTVAHVALYGKSFEIAAYLLNQYQNLLNPSLLDSNGHSVSGLLFELRSVRDFIPPSMMTQLPCLTPQEATWLLHTALSDTDTDLVKFAIGQGADVHCGDFMQHTTPLLLASRMGFLDGCRTLVDHGASACVTDQAGNGPLHYAAQGGHVDTFAFFLTLPDIDVPAFYASYQVPLTLPLLRTLLASLEGRPSLPRPQGWVKWLCLVAPVADRDACARFVRLACPANWVEVLADPSKYPSEDVCTRDSVRRVRHSTLEVYTTGDPYMHPVDRSRMPRRLHTKAKHNFHTKHCSQCSQTQPKPPRVAGFSSGARCPKLLTPRGGLLPKCLPKPSTPPKVPSSLVNPPPPRTRPPFSRPAPLGLHLYPLHVAVLSRNKEVCEYVLSSARGGGGGGGGTKTRLMDLVDGCNRTVYELMVQAPEVFGRVLQSVQLPPRVSERISTMDWTTVLCYVIGQSTGGQHARVQSKKRSGQSKLATLPQWCYLLKIDEYCKTIGLPKLSLDKEGDKIRLFEHMLQEEGLDLNELIGTAVEYNCPWAARLIMERRSPQLDGCLALCDAISLGHSAVMDELIRHGYTPAVALQGDHTRMLSESLLVAARGGRWKEVEEVVSQLPLPLDTLQLMKTFKELLRVSLVVEEGEGVARVLLGHFVSLLSSALTGWSSLECEARYSFLSLLRSVGRFLLVAKPTGHASLRRLVAFCCQRQHCMDTALYQLCGRGCSEEVKLLVDSSVPGAVQQLRDSAQLAPHFYAICGGHLDVLTVEGFGIPSSFSSALPAHVGALLYLSLAPRVGLAAQTLFATRGLPSVQGAYVRYVLNAVTQGRCSFSTLYKDPALVDAFMKTLMAASHEDDCSKLLYSPQGEHLFHPLLLLCLVPNLGPLRPLLEEIRDCLRNTPVDVTTSSSSRSVLSEDRGLSEDVRATVHPVQATLEDALSVMMKQGNALPFPYSVLDLAICFVSAETRETGGSLLEEVLLSYAHSIPLVLVHRAAQNGMWGVVNVASQRIRTLRQVGGFYTLANAAVAGNYYEALDIALRQGKVEVAASIYGSFLLEMEESQSCRQEWGNRLLHLAIKSSLLDHIGALMHDNECIVLGRRSLSLAEVAAYYGRTKAVQFLLDTYRHHGTGIQEEVFNSVVFLAAKRNHSNLLEYLQLQHTNAVCGGRTAGPGWTSFWCQVLRGAVEGGHQSLALKAAGFIPFESWDLLSSHPEYYQMLHWCGYWGLGDLLRLIPFAPQHVFVHHNDTWASAWESAVANGHVGALCSQTPDFPCFPEDLETWMDENLVRKMEDNANSSREAFVEMLLTGSFHRMMTAAAAGSNDRQLVTSNDLRSARDGLRSTAGHCSLFHYGCKCGVLPVVEACLATLGVQAGRVLQYMQGGAGGVTPLHQACKRKGSSPVLQSLLKSLSDAGLSDLANGVNKAGDTPLALACRIGEAESVTLLLSCGVESAIHHTNSNTGDNALHEAVMGGSCEVVRVLCGALGNDDAIAYCLSDNFAGVSPLGLAFALGHHEQASQLVGMLPVRDERTLATAVRDAAREALGWFGLHMRRNGVDISTSHTHFRAPSLYLSKLRKCRTVEETLKEALKSGHSALALCIVEASAGFAVDESMLGLAMLDPEVRAYMIEHDCITQETLISRSWTRDICPAIVRGRASDAIGLTQFVLARGAKLDLEILFEASCTQSDPSFMSYLLQSHLYTNISPEALQRGLHFAAASGNIQTCVLLHSQTLESTFKAEEGLCLPPLAGLLLSPTLSYESLLHSFFNSTIQTAAALPVKWLSHRWTEPEVEYVYRLCPEPDTTGHNPWQVPLSPSSSTELHVEWDTFADAISATSRPREGGSVTAPFLIGVIVFSPSVLGRLIGPPLHSTSTSAHPLRDTRSATLSCNQWPSDPSFRVEPCGGHARITLSYMPDEGVILFPSELEPVAPPLSPEPSPAVSVNGSIPCLVHDSIADIARSMAVRIRRLFHNKLKVSVHLDETLAVVDLVGFNRFAMWVLSILGDCHDAIRIASKSTHWTNVLSSIVISVTVVENSDLKVSFKQNSLAMEVLIGEDVNDYWGGKYECLISELTTCFTEIELQHLQKTLVCFIHSSFLPKIRKLTNCTLDEETVQLCVALDDHQEIVSLPLPPSLQCLPYLKQLRNIKHTLALFCDAVKVLTSDSNCLRSLRQLLRSGITIVLDGSQPPEFCAQGRTPQLHVNPLDDTTSKACFHLYRSTLGALTPPRAMQADPGRGYVAPFACRLDQAHGWGQEHPAVGTASTLTVRFVDYTNSPLTATPRGRCKVTVTAVPQAKASRQIFRVDCSEADWSSRGSVSVQWTPQWYGLHKVAVRVNGFHISGSPWDVTVSRRACQSRPAIRQGGPLSG